MPLAELLSILTAFFFAASRVLVKRGLGDSDPRTATFINMFTSTILFCIIAIPFLTLEKFNPLALMAFIAAGVVGTALGRIVLFEGIERIGASIAGSVNNIHPLFAALVSILFLQEHVTALLLAGTLTTTVGIILLSLGDYRASNWKNFAILLPIASAAVFGTSQVIRKIGLVMMPSPILAAAVNTIAALAFISSFPSFTRQVRAGRATGWKYFALTGVADTSALVCQFTALTLGSVTVVATLSAISPLFVLLLAYLLLRRLEHLTGGMVLGAILIVVGVALVTSSK